MKIASLSVRLFLGVLFLGFAGCKAARAEHHDTWIEVRAPHFTVYSNAGEHEAKRIALQFEEIRAMFQKAFPNLHVDGGKPTVVFALKNEDSLKLLIPDYGLGKNAKRLAGFFRPTFDKNYAIVRTDVTGSGANAYHSLYHEYTHYIFQLNYRGLPVWLNEGLAEFYGNSIIENKEASFGMPDAGQIRILRQVPLIPIATLVSADASSPLYNTQDHSGIFYAESWAMVHYFILAEGVHDQNLLNKFLNALQATDDPVEAANQSFGDLGKLADKLENYARQPAFTYKKMPLQLSFGEKELTARTMAPAEALVAQADYLLHTNHSAEAINVLHEAEKLDPKLAAVHDSLGYYHYLKADNENAEKEYDQALSLDPNDANVFLFRAYIQLRKAGYKKETTPLIRENLEKVIALRPDFATAHAFLCIAYSQDPDTKAKAFEEAKRALTLEPGNLAYYIDAGKALLANGNLEEAKKIAARAQKVANTPRDRAMATSFQRQVDAKANPVSASATSAAPAHDDDSETASSAVQTSTSEGQISELICSRPPEVMLTLSAGNEQILLHVKDIAKIEIKDAGQVATVPCTKWRDRRAKVSYSLTPDGPAHGEIQTIEME